MADVSAQFPVATSETFQTSVLDASRQGPVLVDFWADWCAPCKALEPLLRQVQADLGEQLRIVKVNADDEASLAAQFGIRGLPTLLLFSEGRPVGQLVGVHPHDHIRALIAPYLVTPAEQLIRTAQDCHAQGDPQRADELLTRAIALEPDNGAALRALIPLRTSAGRLAEARELHGRLLRTDRESGWGVALATLIELAELAVDAPPLELLASRLQEQPGDSRARAAQAARHLQQGERGRAMDALLELLRHDRNYQNELGRRGLLAVFELEGEHSALANDYRRRMAAALH